MRGKRHFASAAGPCKVTSHKRRGLNRVCECIENTASRGPSRTPESKGRLPSLPHHAGRLKYTPRLLRKVLAHLESTANGCSKRLQGSGPCHGTPALFPSCIAPRGSTRHHYVFPGPMTNQWRSRTGIVMASVRTSHHMTPNQGFKLQWSPGRHIPLEPRYLLRHTSSPVIVAS